MKRHPLTPLAKLRDQKADEAARELGHARDAARRAERSLHTAETDRTQVNDEIASVRHGLWTELAGGALRVEDLTQGAAWAVGAAQRQEQADQHVAHAETTVVEAHQAAEQARATVAAAQADAEVVAKLLAKAKVAAEDRSAALLEEAAEDTFLARQSRSPRRG